MKGIRRGDQTLRETYTKARDKVKKLIRKSKRSFEKGIASRSKLNPKEFWKYARRNLKTKSGVSPLLQNKNDPNSLKFDDRDKANILQEQFSSVFTKEDIRNPPTLEKRTDMRIECLDITEEMVKNEILALNISKSYGPDEISPIMLIKACKFHS